MRGEEYSKQSKWKIMVEKVVIIGIVMNKRLWEQNVESIFTTNIWTFDKGVKAN